MKIYEFLRNTELFAELPEADLIELSASASELLLPEGEQLFAEGDEGDRAYIIKEGALEIIKHSSGREVLLAVRDEGIIGELALLEAAPRSATVRARVPTTLITIRKEDLDNLLAVSASAAQAMLKTILERLRTTQAQVRQSEQMAQLGTLTAGVAHELNNPAAAVKRSSDQMVTALTPFAEKQAILSQYAFSPAQQSILDELAAYAKVCTAEDSTISALERGDLEQEIEDWLYDFGIEDPWDIAAALVDLDFTANRLVEIKEQFTPEQLHDVLHWVVAIQQAHSLLREIGQGAERISEIVKALKSYAYLDQAPVQSVNIHEGLNNTLVILRHKLNQGIEVRRNYETDLANIEAYGSELNQVWTNMIDNAIDAIDGQGSITINTRHDDNHIIVEIQDNGPGIAENIVPRIFDAFFTTKPPGKGSGLGLNICYNIIVYKHRGDIKLFTEPGFTCFQVWLPKDFEVAAAPTVLDPLRPDIQS